MGNKSVFKKNELEQFYKNKNDIYIIKFIYNIEFGEGNNVNYNTLKENDLFNIYPLEIELTKQDILKIINLGGSNVQDIIID